MIITTQDNYIRSKPFQQAYLSILLSDNNIAIVQTVTDWRELKQFCTDNSVNICEIKLKFMSNEIVYSVVDGSYFFKQGAMGTWPPEDNGMEFYIIGNVSGDVVNTEYWYVPSLTFYRNGTRPISEDSDLIIWKDGNSPAD